MTENRKSIAEIKKEILSRKEEILECMRAYNIDTSNTRVERFINDLAQHLFDFPTITLDYWIRSALNPDPSEEIL